jgi:anti-sigma B factor antagonist
MPSLDGSAPAALHVSRVPGSYGLHLRLVGELDISTARQLRNATAALSERDLANLCLDLTDLEFIDAIGLRALLATHTLVTAHGGRLVLTGLRPLARRMLRITGLYEVLHVQDRQTGTVSPATEALQ